MVPTMPHVTELTGDPTQICVCYLKAAVLSQGYLPY